MIKEGTLLPCATRHAKRRLKERSGIGSGMAGRVVQKAYDAGFKPYQIRGSLRTWLRTVSGQHYVHDGLCLRIYRNSLYIFGGHKQLITVYPIPEPLAKRFGEYLDEESRKVWERQVRKKALADEAKKAKKLPEPAASPSAEIVDIATDYMKTLGVPFMALSYNKKSETTGQLNYVTDNCYDDTDLYGGLVAWVKAEHGLDITLNHIRYPSGQYATLRRKNG